jgi:hypothetical protein
MNKHITGKPYSGSVLGVEPEGPKRDYEQAIEGLK